MSDILNLNQIGNRHLSYLVAAMFVAEALRSVRTWTHSSPPVIPNMFQTNLRFTVVGFARAPPGPRFGPLGGARVNP